MLKMKPACKRCAVSPAPDGKVTICSFERTFCPTYAGAMNHTCPNCGRDLLRRPRRTHSVTSAVAHEVRSNRVS